MSALTTRGLGLTGVLLLAFGLIGLRPLSVSAREKQTPKDRFNQGVALAKQRQYEQAIQVWVGVLDQLDSEDVPKAHKALGLACKKVGKLPEAWHYLTLYLKAADKQDIEAGAWLEQVEKEIERTYRRVAISCLPEGVMLTFSPGPGPDGLIPQSAIRNPQYGCPLTWWFVPGKWPVHATKEGYLPKTVEIDVRERGEQGGHTIRLAAVAQSRSEPTASGVELEKNGPQVTEQSAIRRPQSAVLEWVLIGSGAAASVAGGIFHAVARSRNEDLYRDYKYSADPSAAKKEYDAAYDEEVLPKEIAAYLLYGVGGAAVVTGVMVMAVKHARSDGEEPSSPSVMPMPVPDGAGAMMTVEF